MKHRRGKTTRNRELMARYKAGDPIELLMIRYRLSENRVRAILSDERNRRLTSTDPFYRNMRMNA